MNSRNLLRLTALTALLLLAASCIDKNSSAPAGDGTASSICTHNPRYQDYFTAERLRIDLILAGDSEHQYAFLEEMHREREWAGSPNGLINSLGYGNFFFEAFAGDKLIYSNGFNALFEEWRTTAQAQQVAMAAGQSLWMPFPKQPTHIVLYSRARATGMFEKFFEFDVDPADRHIIGGKENDYNVVALQISGDSRHKVDLVFAGEGYTAAQMPKLRADARRFMDYLFSMEPYASRREDFNVWLVESVSTDSGTDIPQDANWKRTAMDSMFDTFYVDRYLTIMNHKKIAQAVSNAAFDTIFIIANESKYGGGGIYNSYALGTSDHRLSNQVFIHEFGHSFAGLGDEYYDAQVAYEEYYPAGIEPWEPNITTLTDFASKWQDMLEEGTPVPTPADSSYMSGIGVFEGAGYQAKGCYRPYWECRMMNNTAPGFCPVCQRAIGRVIDMYVK